ncbi:MAG TPA: DUF4105 domain-containing protein [Gemmatimonadales bacterium]
MKLAGWLAALAAFVIPGTSVSAQAQGSNGENLQVYLMTMGPGAEIYERFDHNAIWIRDTAAHTDLIYNFGTFEFPHTVAGMLGFVADFASGKPRYWLGVDSSLTNVLEEYAFFRRDVTVQLLNLSYAQREDIAARLARNALPENRTYIYDYYRDNCSTRVRDLLDAVLGGSLREVTVGKPAEGTLRFHTLRSITNDKLLFVGIDAALGPQVDKPLDQWDEMFLPIKVQQHIRTLRVPGPNGSESPLVIREQGLLTIGTFHVDPAPPHWTFDFLLIGIALALVIGFATIAGPPGVIGRLVGSLWLLLMGVGGLLLVFFWTVSANVATHANHNLLVISPLALLLIVPCWRVGRVAPSSWVRRVSQVVLATTGVAVVLALLPAAAGQETLPIVLLTAPPTLAAAALVGWRRMAPGRFRPVESGPLPV